jgi:hypothetical protein
MDTDDNLECDLYDNPPLPLQYDKQYREEIIFMTTVVQKYRHLVNLSSKMCQNRQRLNIVIIPPKLLIL